MKRRRYGKRKIPLPGNPGYKPGKPKKELWRWQKWVKPTRGWPPWKDGGGAWNMRRGIRQKPWNKVARIEKFWSPSPQMTVGATDVTKFSGTAAQVSGTSAQYICFLDAEQLCGNQAAGAFEATQRALQHVKIHRFQGSIMVWINANDQSPIANSAFRSQEAGDDGNVPEVDAVMLTYMWLKLTEVSNTAVSNGVYSAGNFNPRPDQDLPNLMMRDDIMKWGNVLVKGPTPRYGNQKSGISLTDSNLRGYEIVDQGMMGARHIAHVPMPRVPKLGLNLRKGEALVCTAAIWPGPTAKNGGDIFAYQAGGGDVTVNYLQMFRTLCSL